jgi:hypothetical protein
MGIEVPKIPLPEELGPGPAYDPTARREFSKARPAKKGSFRRRDNKSRPR